MTSRTEHFSHRAPLVATSDEKQKVTNKKKIFKNIIDAAACCEPIDNFAASKIPTRSVEAGVNSVRSLEPSYLGVCIFGGPVALSMQQVSVADLSTSSVTLTSLFLPPILSSDSFLWLFLCPILVLSNDFSVKAHQVVLRKYFEGIAQGVDCRPSGQGCTLITACVTCSKSRKDQREREGERQGKRVLPSLSSKPVGLWWPFLSSLPLSLCLWFLFLFGPPRKSSDYLERGKISSL